MKFLRLLSLLGFVCLITGTKVFADPKKDTMLLDQAQKFTTSEDYANATPAYLAVIKKTTDPNDLVEAINYFHDRDDHKTAQLAIDKLKVLTKNLPETEKSRWSEQIRSYESYATGKAADDFAPLPRVVE